MWSSTHWQFRRNRSTAIVAAIAAVVLCAPPARSQTPPSDAATVPAYRYRILGVFDEGTGEPVEGADVIDITSGIKAITTKTGTVSLIFLPDGGSLVRIRKIGYEVQTFAVAISPTDKTPITVLLKAATTLPTVVVTDTAAKSVSPRLRDFDEHRKAGFGRFIGEDVFRKNENENMAELLVSQMPGLMTVTTATGATLLVSTRVMCSGLALSSCQRPNCFVTTYIDGVRVYDASMPTSAGTDMGHLSARDFAAAEFYGGGAILPAGISPTNSKCGTLVLYTRDR